MTSSSQVSIAKSKPQRWDKEKEMYVNGAGGLPEDLDDPSRGETVEILLMGLEDTEANREELGLLDEMGLQDPWDQ